MFVVFGGLVGYLSDDINKFFWMVCIGGGVFFYIKEFDYLVSFVIVLILFVIVSIFVNMVMFGLNYFLNFEDYFELVCGIFYDREMVSIVLIVRLFK